MKNVVKVVYNACYGGFGLSQKAIERMAELGCKWAMKTVCDFEDLAHIYHSEYGFSYYDTNDEIPPPKRHDVILVKVVEELGNEASGACANLQIKQISGRTYLIDNRDGYESVIEPHQINWTSAD